MKPHKPREWTKTEIALLGKESDLSLARRLRRRVSEVRTQRWSRKIKQWQPPTRVGMEPYMPEKVKLRSGPYSLPAVSRRGQLKCALHGWVQVDGYSQAPIPWPLRAGTRSLILCGDLSKAVSQESVLAVAHHWGVCCGIVSRWRKALGVPPVNAGTQRLKRFTSTKAMTRAVRKRISDLHKGRPTNYTVEGKRRLMEALRRPRSAQWYWNSARHFASLRGKVVDPNTRLWTAKEEKLLGTMTDREVAKKIKRTMSAVAARRFLKGIPNKNPEKHPWTKREINMLHRLSPQEVAQRTRHTLISVKFKRRQEGIFIYPPKKPWTPEEDALLGTKPDIQLATILGRGRMGVRMRRVALGINPARNHALYEYWTPEEDRVLGTASDKIVAKRLGRTKGAVQRRRLALGLVSHRIKNCKLRLRKV